MKTNELSDRAAHREMKAAGIRPSEVWDWYKNRSGLFDFNLTSPLHKEVIPEFLRDKEAGNRRPVYINGLRNTLKILPAETKVSVPTTDDLSRLICRETPKSRIATIGRLRSFYAWAVKKKYRVDNPALDLEKPLLDMEPPPCLSYDAVHLLLEAVTSRHQLSDHETLVAILTVWCGVRRAEIMRLPKTAFRDNEIWLPGHAAKTRRPRIIRVPDRVTLEGLDLELGTCEEIRETIYGLRRRLEVDTPNIFRHTAASAWTAKFGPSMAAQQLGTSEVVLNRYYIHPVNEAYTKLFWS